MPKPTGHAPYTPQVSVSPATGTTKGGTPPGVRSTDAPSTTGLRRDSISSAPPSTDLQNRAVKTAEPNGYFSRLYDAAISLASGGKKALDVSKAFLADFATTTSGTFTSAWNSKGQVVPETIKFGASIAGFGAGLTQAAAAGMAEIAEKAGYEVKDASVDGLSPLLKKAGITTSGLTKTQLRQLGTSFATLQLGYSGDVHLENSALQMRNNDGETLTISNIHLDNLQPALSLSSDATNNQQLLLSADTLSFTLEYTPKQGEPTKLAINIPAPKLSGETNLLSILGEVIVSYCQALPNILMSNSVNVDNAPDTEKSASLWQGEKTDFSLDASGVVVQIESPGDLLKDYSSSKDSVIALNDIHVQQSRSLAADKLPETPEVRFGLMEIDNLDAGPLKLQSGFLRLDNNLNGELVFTLMADYKALDAYCPEWLPTTIRNAVTGTDASQQHAAVRMGVKIQDGEIDLDSLRASGLNESGLTYLQKLIQNHLIATLQSEHTRIRSKPATGKELKIHIPMSTDAKGRRQSNNENCPSPGGSEHTGTKNLRNMIMKHLKSPGSLNGKLYKTSIPLPDQSRVFITEDKKRGKISLKEALETVDISLQPKKNDI